MQGRIVGMTAVLTGSAKLQGWELMDGGTAGSTTATDRFIASACRCAGAIAHLREPDPNRWLDSLCAQLVEAIPGDVAAAARTCAAQSDSDLAINPPQAMGSAGMPTEEADANALWHSAGQWDRVAIDNHANIVRTCTPRSAIGNDAAWAATPWRSARRSIGLHDFARATVPVDAGIGLVVRIDGLREAWSASTATLALLAAASEVAASSFDRRFIQPLRYRRALLEQLTKVQREIVPLLATGLSERVIGQRLHRSPHTIHQHAKRIYAAWHVDSRYALRDKWLAADSLPGYEPPRRTEEAKQVTCSDEPRTQ